DADPDNETTLWEGSWDLATDPDLRVRRPIRVDEDVEDAPTQGPDTTPRLRVLAVDDEIGVLLWLQAELSEHDVRVTTDAREAAAGFVEGDYHVLVCDLEMPDAPGSEVHATIQALAPDRAGRVVFLTDRRDALDTSRIAGGQAIAVLRKPVDPRQLRAALYRALQVR
ncbi:MAG: response regulator, partial [Myxococcota bacterium]